jgi:hypothetical protein
MYCIASKCARSNNCKKHVGHSAYEAAIDWSTCGSGKVDHIGICEVHSDCGDTSRNYPLYEAIDLGKTYSDKYGAILKADDIIKFDNGHRFKIIIKDSNYCLQALDQDLPLLIVDKICVDKTFYSGAKEAIT